MTDVEVMDSASLIEGLPSSAWLREGVVDPDNVVAVLGKKGGPGKTSKTQNLVDAAVRMGLNVLVLDGDPQGNISLALDCKVKQVSTGKRGLGGKLLLEPDRLTMVEVLDADQDGVVDEAVQMTPWKFDSEADFTRGGPLIPGKIGTLAIVPTYSPMEDMARGWNMKDLGRLDRALNRPLQAGGVAPNLRWDLVLVDMLPGGSDLARVFLKAVRRYLLLTTAEAFGINAIADTLKFARDTRDNWGNPRLENIGLAFTSYNPKGRVARAMMADLRAHQATTESANLDIWQPRVPNRTVVPLSQSYRLPVSRFLIERQDRSAAMDVCQVSEAMLLNILRKINHPDAEELDRRWRTAWPTLSPWATGAITEKELALEEKGEAK
jgi:cellulose biosynthesis protein BcsQ